MQMFIHRKIKRVVVLLLAVVLLLSTATVCTAAVNTRYSMSGTFAATGSPLLNENFTTDQWNKWEIVAWGVFLSNFVVPMVDSYETAFSTSSTAGSRGSGFKALNFSESGDPAAKSILQNFLQFAVDNAMNIQKDLYVSYYHIDQAGNIIVPSEPDKADTSAAVVIEDVQNPTKREIQPASVGLANFASLLPANLGDMTEAAKKDMLNNDVGAWIAGTSFGSNSLDDVFGVNTAIYRPWKLVNVVGPKDYPDMIALPPSAGKGINREATTAIKVSSEFPGAYASADNKRPVQEIAVAKLPILWLKANDGTYVKVWDMLDPWDYQVFITMLAKELNSDSTLDTSVGLVTSVWNQVMDNLDAAFDGKTALKMDCFGNITTMLNGKPIVVIPAAYNKHLTTVPMVNLVNSLFLTGPTSGVSSQQLLDKGKMPVKSIFWWISNDNETSADGASNFGPGMPAFGWKGTEMPNNAVALYYDSDTLAYMTFKDRIQWPASTPYYKNAIDYAGYKLFPQVAATLGVLDLDVGEGGNRKFTRAGKSDFVTPRLTLTGISKAAGLGKEQETSFASRKAGTKSLMTALTFQESIIGLLPASYKEGDTEYVQKMLWQHVTSDVLGKAVVIPVAMQSGSNSGIKTWAGLARSFVNYYGTEYFAKNKDTELRRLSRLLCGIDGTKSQSGEDIFISFTRALMYDADNKPSLALINHAKIPEMASYMNVFNLGMGATYLGLPDWGAWVNQTGFIWKEPKYVNTKLVDASGWGSLMSSTYKSSFPSMTVRWVKAYPTNAALTSVATYLGMRGDTEFAAAAAPYVYMSYLNIYGVGSVDGQSGVNVSTLNKNPTKFNDKIFDAADNPLFGFNPVEGTTVKTAAERQSEVNLNIYKLLSPTEGHEYKRELISSYIGNLVYEQYNNIVYGGTLEYRSGGIQNIVTRSQTGFLRFPSLEDNVFTRWFYEEYATVALVLLAIGMVFIIAFGIFRGRKVTWFFVSTVLLVSSVVLIPFVNDIASAAMDGLVSSILKDKTTVWSMTEMIANSRMEEDFLSTGLTPEEAEVAKDITKSLSLAYSDRSLVLKQDISHKVVSLGNFEAYQQFASTRWMLPTILRQFTASDGSAAYMYVPLIDVADDAANAYWWYNPEDALYAGGIAASDKLARYAIGTAQGTKKAEYTAESIKGFYPDYHWVDLTKMYVDPTVRGKLSYRSITHSYVGLSSVAVPVHDYIYIYMNNAYDATTATPETATQQVAVLNLPKRPVVVAGVNDTNKTYWGDPAKITDGLDSGGAGTFISKLVEWKNINPTFTAPQTVVGHGAILDKTQDPLAPVKVELGTMTYAQAHLELLQTAQRYVRDQRDTMYGEFAYLWSTETPYPYFYALVKDTMEAMGRFDYTNGVVDSALTENAWYTKKSRLGLMLNAVTGSPNVVTGVSMKVDPNVFYGNTRRNFMYQSGFTLDADFRNAFPNAMWPGVSVGSSTVLFTGYGRDVLDLESMFHNVIPYMYEMTLMTGGLVGEDEHDKGLFGKENIEESQYRTYAGLPHSWLYRCNWASKIVEAPEYNKPERIGYFVNGEKKYAEVTMTYLPDAYKAVKDGGREMIFSEAQLKMSGLAEHDLTTLELKLIKLNKKVSDKWTTMINYINAKGVTAEVMCRQMALDALLMFNEEITPKGLGNTAYALMPSTVDLRSLSFDTIMRVILLNTSKNTNFFGTDAMESTITEFGLLTGVVLCLTAAVCVYGVTLMRAFFLAFLFLMGVYGVARGVFASNASKKATLLGYLTNIGLLFVLSFLYYEVFNILMIGADSSAYVSSGLKGVSAAPMVSILIVLVASIVYIVCMFLMFRVALGSVISGTHDLGYGIYKDKAQASLHRFARSWSDIRAGHAFEDMSNQISETRAAWGASVAGVATENSEVTVAGTGGKSGSGKSKRRSSVRPSGMGSGVRAVQSNGVTDNKSARAASALDDYESVDSVISRGGERSANDNPAGNLEDYLGLSHSETDGEPKK